MARTAAELYDQVLDLLRYEETSSMTPDEFNRHYNIAQLEYIKTRHWAWDRHQKTLDDLDKIKVITNGLAGFPTPLQNVGNNVAGEEVFELPADYFRMLSVGVKFCYIGDPCIADNTISDWTAAVPTPEDRDKMLSQDYYSAPYHEWPNIFYQQYDRKLFIKMGKSIAKELLISYLRYPTVMEVDANGEDLPVPTVSTFEIEQSDEIAKWCVHSYLEKLQELRMQTMQLILGKAFNQSPPPGQP